MAIANTVQNATELRSAIHACTHDRSLQVLDLGAVLEKFIDTNGDRMIRHLQGDCGITPLAADLVAMTERRRTALDADLITASLTAALRPIDRGLLIAAVSSLLATDSANSEGCPVLVTSTQLVEAGVNLSFNQVFRDFAPIPNLAQAAGRCNRSFEAGHGRVTLWRLGSPAHHRPPAELIYARGGDRLTPTTVALGHIESGGGPIPEFELITNGIEKYYEILHAADHRTHDRDSLVQAYRRARGETLREASLIDEQSADVLVVRTAAEGAVLRQYLSEKVAKKFETGRSAMIALQQLFASVPKDRVDQLDESAAIVSDMGFEADVLDEFAVIDDRDRSRYLLPSGAGLRQID